MNGEDAPAEAAAQPTPAAASSKGDTGVTNTGDGAEPPKSTSPADDTAALVEKAKQRGNRAFACGNYEDAIQHFTEAIALDKNNHVLYSNRSGARLKAKLCASCLHAKRRLLAAPHARDSCGDAPGIRSGALPRTPCPSARMRHGLATQRGPGHRLHQPTLLPLRSAGQAPRQARRLPFPRCPRRYSA